MLKDRFIPQYIILSFLIGIGYVILFTPHKTIVYKTPKENTVFKNNSSCWKLEKIQVDCIP